jgi:hypothetical protein
LADTSPTALNTVIIYILWHSNPILPPPTAYFCLPLVPMKSVRLPVTTNNPRVWVLME